MRNECWVNVYSVHSKFWYGSYSYSKELSVSTARQAVANGYKLLYRIHVRLK